MSELLQVRVNPVVMWGFDIPQTEGLFINEDGFKGWDSGTPTRRDAVPIPGGHGQFDVPVVRDAATPAIDGTARAFTAAGLQQLGDLVNAVGADGSRVKLTVSDRYVTRWAWARLAEVDFIDSGHREGDLYWASFRFLFVLPDPRRYGPVSNDGPASSIQLTNRGNFPATPVLTVAGSRPGGYTIVGPAGQQFVVGQALTAGHPHVIDMEDGTLSIDGAVVPGAVTAPRLFTIPAATSGTVSLAGAPAGVTISGQIPDTFI